jgi:hypothetical protein
MSTDQSADKKAALASDSNGALTSLTGDGTGSLTECLPL